MGFAGPFNRTGPEGPQGPRGKNGTNGLDGKNGRDGRNGKDGKDGITTVVYQGSLGGGSTGTTPTDETTTVTVASGATSVVESIALSEFIAVEFLINCRKADFSVARTQRMIVNKLAASLQDSVYGRVGTLLNCELSTQITGSNAELTVKNNEAFDVLVSFKKYILI